MSAGVGAGEGGLSPAAYSILADYFPKERLAAAMGVAGAFFDGTPLPMVTGIAICAVISFTLTHLSLGRGRRPAEVPAE